MHTFRFDPRINLIVGRNEAGKSTLFEIMTRLMFDRHNTKSEEIRLAQPLGSSLGPEAWMIFTSGQKRYRIHKRFLQDPISEFYTEINGTWVMNDDGDTSDMKLRKILGGETSLKGTAKPENRGLAQALWYLQSDGAVPQSEWNEGVKHGIQGLVNLAVKSDAEETFLRRLETEYRKYWTPEGRKPAKGEIASLEAEIDVMEKELSEFREAELRLNGFRQDLESLLEHKRLKSVELEAQQAELKTLSKKLDDAEIYENELAALESNAAELEKNLRDLQKDRSLILENRKEIQSLAEEIAILEQNLSDEKRELRTVLENTERYNADIKNRLEPSLQLIERELKGLQSARNLRNLEKNRNILEDHLRRIKALKNEIELKQQDLSGLSAPDIREIRKFERLNEDFANLNAKIEASAVRVYFKWLGERRDVTATPPATAVNADEFVVREATEFNIRGVGTITVRSGAEELKELLSRHDDLKKKIDGLYSRFGVNTSDELMNLYERRREIEGAIVNLKQRLDDVERANPDAETELERVLKGIAEEKRFSTFFELSPEDNKGSVIREMILEREEKKEKLIGDISQTQKTASDERKRYEDLQNGVISIASKLSDRRARKQKDENEIERVLRNYGTFDNLDSLIAAAENDRKAKNERLETLRNNYGEKVTAPKEKYSRTEALIGRLKEQMHGIDIETSRLNALIEGDVSRKGYTAMADLEIKLNAAKKRVRMLQLRSEGVRLLKELAEQYEKSKTEALSAPVSRKLDPWLKFLTDGNYGALNLDLELKPSSVSVPVYESSMPVESLSHGMREQIIVLLRLAIGVIASTEERNLIVIDDRLVNADTVRMKRFCDILSDAARSCQIIIATCNDTPYSSLESNVIHVPADGA